MKPILPQDLLEAAAWALVGERCRRSYLHDVRGGLQALQSAVELLARAAKSPGDNERIADKAITLARRALGNYESSLVELVDQLTPHLENAATVDVGLALAEVLRFVHNDAGAKSITFRSQPVAGIFIRAEAQKFRLLLLGLCAAAIDELAPGAVVDVDISRDSSQMCIAFFSDMRSPPLLTGEELWSAAAVELPAYEFLLALTRRWACANGGGVELSSQPQSQRRGALRIRYPCFTP
jgi:signal transduction histidine kinase